MKSKKESKEYCIIRNTDTDIPTWRLYEIKDEPPSLSLSKQDHMLFREMSKGNVSFNLFHPFSEKSDASSEGSTHQRGYGS